ncbi:protease complex subunit PrcB family protein [Gelria sp. Kuro-4]|uniref:protease complex subunit PrcB family protein n=1 Tax=Gelria sp. Kuro-4 TaxID=2796927 RepID=UPI001C7F97E4|nr:protease complex subunit PrcB family protein [Gelria sp. Kuro-4]
MTRKERWKRMIGGFARNVKKLIPDPKFVAGVLVGVLSVVGVGFSGSQTVPAAVNQVQFVLHGDKIQPSDRPGYYFNGRAYVPAALSLSGTNYVPLRFVAESLGLKVAWDQATRSIILDAPAGATPVEPEPEKQLPLKKISVTEAPPAVRELAQHSRELELAQTITLGDQTYLLVTRGMKPTGGYGVDIESVVDTGDEIVVKVKYRNPAPGAAVTQVITYPCVLAAIPKAERPVRFQGTGDVYVPQLQGLEHLDPVVAELTPNLKLFAPVVKGSELTVRGAVRVWEGTLNWEVLADGGAGAVVRRGEVQAAGGAPDWGYFSFSLPAGYARGDNLFLRLFCTSPKAGFECGVVEVSLDTYATYAERP